MVSHLATWTLFHTRVYGPVHGSNWSPVLPLIPEQVIAVASLFKAGGYRSFANYWSSIKSKHLDEGFTWTENLTHVGRWTTRSVLRGIGPARQSQAISLDLVMRLPLLYEPLVPLGPTHPREAFLLSSMFLMREVELSATCVKHLTLNDDEPAVAWRLSASKTDPQAHGVTRSWGRLCEHSALPCPYHIAKHVLNSAMQFADFHRLDDHERRNLPLFHDGTGCPPTKAKVVSTFEALATKCDIPLLSADGLNQFGGHSARVTGARALASHGVEVAKIRILARHSGEAIMRYVADAPLAAIRTDLGMSKAKTSSRSISDATSKKLQAQLDKLVEKVNEQEQQMRALAIAARSNPSIVYVQNLSTLAIHGLRAGDSTSTPCGWSVGPKKVKRGAVKFLHSLKGECWETMCEWCLIPEREAARAVEQIAIDSIEPSAAKSELAK